MIDHNKIGSLVEVTNDPNSEKWEKLRLAGIDLLDDHPYVCIPVHQLWLSNCDDSEILCFKYARIVP